MSDIDLSKIIKIHEPTIDAPVPKMGAGLLGASDIFQEISIRLPEFMKPLRYFLVGVAYTAGDIIGRQFFKETAGTKTPPGYYGHGLILSLPAVFLGRIAADMVGGSPPVKALVIGTVANLFMQVRHLFEGPGFSWTMFIINEVLLVPLSLIVAGDESAVLGRYGN